MNLKYFISLINLVTNLDILALSREALHEKYSIWVRNHNLPVYVPGLYPP